MTEKPVYDNADEPVWRIATVVFSNVPAVDYGDAAHLAERAVRSAISPSLAFRAERTDAVFDVPIDVADVRDLARGSSDSFMVIPSTDPYRTHGKIPGNLPEGVTRSYSPGSRGHEVAQRSLPAEQQAEVLIDRVDGALRYLQDTGETSAIEALKMLRDHLTPLRDDPDHGRWALATMAHLLIGGEI
ncbi:MAG: hypothetical protein WC054_00675 [Candidatus Nanopelagicales bacterium]